MYVGVRVDSIAAEKHAYVRAHVCMHDVCLSTLVYVTCAHMQPEGGERG